MVTKKLKSVRVVTVTKIPVYDLEVNSMNSNFCLGNGIVVHNSKDIADAVSGMIYSLYQDIDHAGQISNKQKVNTYSDFMKERAKSPGDNFQEMVNNLF